jgi:hypothetical protein
MMELLPPHAEPVPIQLFLNDTPLTNDTPQLMPPNSDTPFFDCEPDVPLITGCFDLDYFPRDYPSFEYPPGPSFAEEVNAVNELVSLGTLPKPTIRAQMLNSYFDTRISLISLGPQPFENLIIAPYGLKADFTLIGY